MNFLKHLFEDNPFEYVPKPIDLVLSILIMAMGTATFFRDGWVVFGVCSFILGLAFGIFSILAMGWSSAARYWQTLDNLVKDIIKSNQPELWAAFWKYINMEPPKQLDKVQVIERTEDKDGNFTTLKFKNLPASPNIMQMIADAVLTGTPFSETEIANRKKIVSTKKFRELQKEFRKNGYLRANVIKDGKEVPSQGYTRTKKGTEVLLEYASESVKAQLLQ